MPLIFIVVLGISVGEGFGQKADDKLRVPWSSLTRVCPAGTPAEFQPPSAAKWSDLVLKDLNETADIRVEIIDSRAEGRGVGAAQRACCRADLGSELQQRASACSFWPAPRTRPRTLPPAYRPSFTAASIPSTARASGSTSLTSICCKIPTQQMAASIVGQVAQGPCCGWCCRG